MKTTISVAENAHVKKLDISVIKSTLDIIAYDYFNRVIFFESIDMLENPELFDLIDDNDFIRTEVFNLVDYLQVYVTDAKRDSFESRTDSVSAI